MIASFFFIWIHSCDQSRNSPDDMLKKNMVHIIVTKQLADYESPWLKLPSENQNFVGIIVTDNLILTTSYAVENNQVIELQLMGQSKKLPTEIVWEDREINLALLKIPEEWKKLVSIFPRSSNIVSNDKEVSVIKVLAEDRYTKVPARIINNDISQVPTSTYDLVSYDLETQKKGLGWGEPVMFENKLIGIVDSQSDDMAGVIPVGMIEKFLADKHEKDQYKGFAGIGINGASIRGHAFSKKYGFDEAHSGFLVTEVLNHSNFLSLIHI